jgi:cellulose biosynthesis protein BcsQ
MTYVVPFMNGKGGTGKSTLARCYAVEAARGGASILIADLDDEQKTTAIWAANRKRNGLQPDIRVEVASARKAYDLVGQTDVLVIDAPGWADAQTLFVAKWATFTVVPTRANRSDDLAATVSLLHKFSAEKIPAWRFGVVLNGLRAATAVRDNDDARAYLKSAGYEALPGFIRDLKTYEVAMLEGRAITETDRPALNEEAFKIAEAIAQNVLEAGRKLELERKDRSSQVRAGFEKQLASERETGRER